MPVATVSNSVVLPDGSQPTKVEVSVRLMSHFTGWLQGAYVTATGDEVLGQVSFKGEADWGVGLIPNDELTPSGTFYRVIERVAGLLMVHYIVVTGSGPLLAMLVDDPENLPTDFGAIGGSLTPGSVTELYLADEAVTNAKVSPTAAIALSKLAVNPLGRELHTGTQSADTLTDGTTVKAFLAAERTKLAGVATGATANDPDVELRDRDTHSGTQLASSISDFNTQVRTSRLEQMATPAAAVAFGAQRITALADGTTAQDAITKAQLDAAGRVTSSSQTANYTLVLADAGKAVEQNVGSANTVTVPPNSSVAFPIGTVIGVEQVGAGTTTVVAGAGVTVQSRGGLLALAGQYAVVSLRKVGTDVWRLAGDVS